MPTPTPTLIPSSQIVQAVQATQNIIDSAVNQGIVGVLLLIAIAAVFTSIGFAIRAYASRNVKPESTTVNSAVDALAEITRNRDEEARLDREERKAETAAWREIIKDQNERFIESINHIGDGYNRLGDTLQAQTGVLTAINVNNQAQTVSTDSMRADLNQMTHLGSVPLRGLIDTVNQIKVTVDTIQRDLLPCAEIRDLHEEDKRMYQANLDAVKADIEILKTSMQARIDDKRKEDSDIIKPVRATSEQPAVNVPTSNLLSGDEAASLPLAS